MVSVALHMQPSGIITLPKKWRSRFPTRNFLAHETPEGLLIKPIVHVEYWEDTKGNFGLHFPTGIDSGQLLKNMIHASKVLDEKGKKKKSRLSKK